MSDLFHMNIEETDMPAALRKAGGHTTEVHLADNTRPEPGTGDINFVAADRALLDVGFQGYMAYECGVSGNTPRQRAKNLARSLEYVRDCLARAQR